jgi:hypothetical protein
MFLKQKYQYQTVTQKQYWQIIHNNKQIKHFNIPVDTKYLVFKIFKRM